MTPAARIQFTISLLHEIVEQKRPADTMVHHALRTHRFIGSHDRRSIREWIFEFYRSLARILWRIRCAGFQKLASLEPGAVRVLFAAFLMDRGHASLEDIKKFFDGHHYHPQPLSPEEDRVLTSLSMKVDPLDLSLEAQTCLPEHWMSYFEKTLGAEWPTIAASLNQQALTDIRLNTLKGSLEEGRAQILHVFPDAFPTPYVPTGFRLSSRAPLTECALYTSGLIEVQDEGSQLVSRLVAPEPGMYVLDYCAGAGGKTLALAALMNNQGRIVALDVAPNRLKRAQVRLLRAGVHNTQCRVLDEKTKSWLSRQKGRFDRILLDVPCSGSGTWRRNPDLKWRMTPDALPELVHKQSELLKAAVPLLKEGGRLIYATCSLFPCENQEQMVSFLEAHPSFDVIPVSDLLQNQGLTPITTEPFLQLWPHLHRTDGFFATVLIKKT